MKLAPEGGRSSSGTLPFFNLGAPDAGIIGAIGWSGQWAATFRRDQETGMRIQAGMETTHLKLHPGEQIRSPRILLFFWRGDRISAHNRFRQFLLKHYTPKQNKQGIMCPISISSWGMVSEAEHLKKIDIIAKNKIPVEYYWIDAGWYGECNHVSDWYPQVGSWECNPSLYPNGFKPISDAVHKNGMKFLLWFDPERVYRDSQIYREHPEWLLSLRPEDNQNPWGGFDGNFLFNMGCDEAREWMTNLISKKIADWGIDIFREDFNIDPLLYWRTADEPDRQGITELKYIEGFYAFWDELLRRHSGLLIDNCASGGRRIDLETIRRSVLLWRSDLQCSGDYDPIGTQCQTFGLAYWVPQNAAACIEVGNNYDFRSTLGSGLTISWPGIQKTDFPAAWARMCVEEEILVRPFYYGNYYPLTDYSLSEEVWLAYQLDRPDLKEGVVIAYRRKRCPYRAAHFKLNDLVPERSYMVKNLNTGKTEVYSGADLMNRGLQVEMNDIPDSVIFLYSMK
jgi:alpha-galactosidase